MVRLVSAWVLVNGLLLAPSWIIAAAHGSPFPWVALESAVVAGGLGMLPRDRWSVGLARVAAVGLVLLALALFADVVFQQSLGRPLDLSLDLYLIDAVRRLSVGNLGMARTALWAVVIVVAAAAAVLFTGSLVAPWAKTPDPIASRASIALAVTAVAIGLAGTEFPPVAQRFPTPGVTFVLAQSRQFNARREERAEFLDDLEAEPAEIAEASSLLQGLQGRNVVLSYIESYGVAALDDPQFAAVIRPLLDSANARLTASGIHLVTGRLVSPTLGGQSWYAHGTMLSGLWLENQLRYELLLTSERETLVDDFRRAGYRTTTVMPAITTPWPEALRLGYDNVYTAQNMSYAGPPFFWVTMPDQFTWSFVGGLLREASDPTFIEAAMVSSHAPWIPVVPLVEWDEIGDGSRFEPYRMDGYPPEEMWWDVDTLRVSYAASTAYSLETMAQFAERYLDDRTVLIVSGDHQAAPWVTGSSVPDVPVHVMARDSTVLAPFVELGFVPGPIPAAGAPARRMDEFREWFVGAYSQAPPANP